MDQKIKGLVRAEAKEKVDSTRWAQDQKEQLVQWIREGYTWGMVAARACAVAERMEEPGPFQPTPIGPSDGPFYDTWEDGTLKEWKTPDMRPGMMKLAFCIEKKGGGSEFAMQAVQVKDTREPDSEEIRKAIQSVSELYPRCRHIEYLGAVMPLIAKGENSQDRLPEG